MGARMTRLILLGSGCLALVGCSIALAQGAPVPVPTTGDILGPVAGTGGILGMGGAAWVAREALRAAADIGGELKAGREMVASIKASIEAQGRTLADILVEQRAAKSATEAILIEQRASKLANEANGVRLDRIEGDLEGIGRAVPRHR